MGSWATDGNLAGVKEGPGVEGVTGDRWRCGGLGGKPLGGRGHGSRAGTSRA